MRLSEYQVKGLFIKFGIPIHKQQVNSKAANLENKQVKKEIYLRIEFDPFVEKTVIIASKLNIPIYNHVNQLKPNENLISIPISIFLGLMNFQIRKIAVFLEIQKESWDKFAGVLNAMWQVYTKMDATLIAIDPLILNIEGNFFALSSELILDDNALFRHAEELMKFE